MPGMKKKSDIHGDQPAAGIKQARKQTLREGGCQYIHFAGVFLDVRVETGGRRHRQFSTPAGSFDRCPEPAWMFDDIECFTQIAGVRVTGPAPACDAGQAEEANLMQGMGPRPVRWLAPVDRNLLGLTVRRQAKRCQSLFHVCNQGWLARAGREFSLAFARQCPQHRNHNVIAASPNRARPRPGCRARPGSFKESGR